MVALIEALVFVAVFGSAALGTPVAESRQTSLCENSATTRNCWGEYDVDTDYYVTWPNTGVTREVSRIYPTILGMISVTDELW